MVTEAVVVRQGAYVQLMYVDWCGYGSLMVTEAVVVRQGAYVQLMYVDWCGYGSLMMTEAVVVMQSVCVQLWTGVVTLLLLCEGCTEIVECEVCGQWCCSVCVCILSSIFRGQPCMQTNIVLT